MTSLPSEQIPLYHSSYVVVPKQNSTPAPKPGAMEWDSARRTMVYRPVDSETTVDFVMTGASEEIDLSGSASIILPGGVVFARTGSTWKALHTADLVAAKGLVVGNGDGTFRAIKVKSANGTISVTHADGTDADINIEVNPKSALPIPNGTRGDIVISEDGMVFTVKNDSISNTMLSHMGLGLKGRVEDDDGPVADLSPSEVAGMLPLFSSTSKGLAPSLPGNPTGYRVLFDDGWKAVPAAMDPSLLPKLSDAIPPNIGASGGNAGSSAECSRADHKHALADNVITTSGGRIDGILRLARDPGSGEEAVNLRYLNIKLSQLATRGGPAPWKTPVPWTPGMVCAAAAPADAVIYKSGTYVCRIPHTSGATFDKTKWVLLGYSTDTIIEMLEGASSAVQQSALSALSGEPMVVVTNAAGHVMLDYRVGRSVKLNVTGHITSMVINNCPGPNRWAPMFMEIINPSGFNLAWPDATFWPNGLAAPALGAGRHLITLMSTDAGSSFYAMIPGQGFSPL